MWNMWFSQLVNFAWTRCPWQLNWLTCRAAASTCSSDWTWWGTLQTGHGFPEKVPKENVGLVCLDSFIREFDWLKSWVSRSISMKFHSAFGIAELKNLPFFKVILSSCPWENLQLLITTPGRKPTQSILSRIRKLPVASIVGVWNHGVRSVTSFDVGQENWWARDFQWGVDILQPIFSN